MGTLKHHASRRMCEFKFIMPTLIHYLEHIFLIKNNGYIYDIKSGRIKIMDKFIDSYKPTSQEMWDEIIKKASIKEHFYLFQHFKMKKIKNPSLFEEELKKKCDEYKPIYINDNDFNSENLYKILIDFNNNQQKIYKETGIKIFIRLKMTESDSLITNINSRSDKYIKKIVLNFIEAWTLFLNEEIKQKNYSDDEDNSGSIKNTFAQISFLTEQKNRIIKN